MDLFSRVREGECGVLPVYAESPGHVQGPMVSLIVSLRPLNWLQVHGAD